MGETFLCEWCDEIHPIKDLQIVLDMDGEEGDPWQLCPRCADEIYTCTRYLEK